MYRAVRKGASYTQRFGGEDGLVSLLVVDNPFKTQPANDSMDHLVLLVMDNGFPEREIEHWIIDGSRVQVRRIGAETLENRVVGGEHHQVVQWLVQGDILIDRSGYLTDFRSKLLNWSPLLREQKLLCEFSGFVQFFHQAREDLRCGRLLDAYAGTLSALHYWAHIALVEEGMHPELTVWEQMRKVNPGIYKLFEELTSGAETLEQRVRLVLLACEFSMLNKMQSSCALLIRLIGERSAPWTPSELMEHPDLAGLSLYLSELLQKLVKRGCIREVVSPGKGRGEEFRQIRYAAVN